MGVDLPIAQCKGEDFGCTQPKRSTSSSRGSSRSTGISNIVATAAYVFTVVAALVQNGVHAHGNLCYPPSPGSKIGIKAAFPASQAVLDIDADGSCTDTVARVSSQAICRCV
jgi:hypothetical protein